MTTVPSAQSPARPQVQANLIQPNGAVPALFDPTTGAVQLPAGLYTEGLAVVAELQGTGTLYTVPADDTLEGFVALLVAGPATGSGEISAATGGAQLVTPGCGASPAAWVVAPVTIAGGGGGNAVSVTEASSGVVLSAVLAGYV